MNSQEKRDGAQPAPEVSTSNPAGDVGVQISNAEFIAAVFHTLRPDSVVAVCSKSGDPTQGGWLPMRADTQIEKLLPGNNNYANCASVKLLPDGTVSVKAEQAMGYHVLVLDDVGTKVELAALKGVTPTWEIETSPGNSQMGFVYKAPLTGQSLSRAIQQAAIKAGLCDPGATGPVRWFRLPEGVNGKEKYRDANGQPFECKLKQWNPDLRYSASELVTIWGLEIEASPSQSGPHCDDVVASRGDGHDKLSIEQLHALVSKLNPNMGREEWIRVLMAVWHETGGSAQGFDLIDRWSSAGKTYPGGRAVMVQWKSFRQTEKPYTAGTLIAMAKEAGADVAAILQMGDAFKKCETVVIESSAISQTSAKTTAVTPVPVISNTNAMADALHPLGRFSASKDLDVLAKNMVEQKPLLSHIALLGQTTVIYAQANTGKTLITIQLLIEAIKARRVDPSKVFYINMDDNSSGLLTKCRLAQEYGFQMLADGHQGFQAKDFRAAMIAMIEAETAKGVVVILDTLKKFVNTMDKVSSSSFAAVIRQFCMKGGTVIALAHTNKNPGANGKPVYAGTTDILDDFDCAFTLATVSHDPDRGQKLVEFENIKRRGDVALNVAYSYASGPQIPYEELVLSVQEVDAQQLAPIKEAAEVQSDAKVIAAVEASILEGVTTKMKLIDAVAKRLSISKRDSLKVIEKYTGTDPQKHRWNFVVGARGAQHFEMLKPPVETPVVLPDVPTHFVSGLHDF